MPGLENFVNDLKYVKREFDETLGYVRQDLLWLVENSGLNYTIALLVGVGCEALAACYGDSKRLGESVFASLLPNAPECQTLSNRLYSAIRDGLAHGFDTKHLIVDGLDHQIYIDSTQVREIAIVKNGRGIGLSLGIGTLARALCRKITEFETELGSSEETRKHFLAASQQRWPARLTNTEADAWRSLLRTSGFPC